MDLVVAYKQDGFTSSVGSNCCSGFWNVLFRTALFLVNLLIFLCGAAVVATGAILHCCFLANFADYLDAASIVIMAVGVVIVLIAFMGCSGACMKNSCMMKTYGIVLMVEVGCGIAAYLCKGHVEGWITYNMKNALKHYNNFWVVHGWDFVQPNFHCCGVDSWQDWSNSTLTSSSSAITVPDSCCKTQTKGCGNEVAAAGDPEDIIYTQGCLSQIYIQHIESKIAIAWAVAIAIAIFQVLGAAAGFVHTRWRKGMSEEKVVGSYQILQTNTKLSV